MTAWELIESLGHNLEIALLEDDESTVEEVERMKEAFREATGETINELLDDLTLG